MLARSRVGAEGPLPSDMGRALNQAVEVVGQIPLDAAFTGNRLLAMLTSNDRALLEPHMAMVPFEAGEPVLRPGDPVQRALFPYDKLLVSLLVQLNGGRSVEVASIGKEGALGGIISCGASPAFAEAVVQIPGSAVSIPIHALELAKQASPHLRNLFCRYSDFLLSQVMQSVACNAFHTIEERAARWLLHTQDRVGSNRIALTQEALAALLGVQRTTVNAVARSLQEKGLITNRRGTIQVHDRAGLLQVACGCYDAVEKHFGNVLGADGRGGAKPADCG